MTTGRLTQPKPNFVNRTLKPEMPGVRNENTRIEGNRTLKYLGIFFVRCKSPKQHMDEAILKVKKGLTALKLVSNMGLLHTKMSIPNNERTGTVTI